MADSPFRRLDDLTVLFVSGVKYPATDRRFFLVKEARWEGFVQQLRANQPDLATRFDALLAAGEYDTLEKEVAVLNTSIATSLHAALQDYRPQPWDAIEPTAKDMEGLDEGDIRLYLLYKRVWTAEMRRKHKEKGGHFAGPDDSYPIQNCEDVGAAYASAGRARGSPETIRGNTVRIARQLNLTHCLPRSVQGEKQFLQEVEQMDETTKGKKKTAPPSDEDEMLEEMEEEPKKKKAKKSDEQPVAQSQDIGVLGSMIRAAARGAGLEVISRADYERIQKAMSLLAGAASESQWPPSRPDDDEPVGESFGLLDDQISFDGGAPDDQTPWEDPWPLRKNFEEQADMRLGKPYPPNSARMDTVRMGKPITVLDTDSVTLGTPVTKEDVDQILVALDGLQDLVEKGNEHTEELEERVRRLEAIKGISRIAPPSDDDSRRAPRVARKAASGDDLWAGSPFDVPTD